MSELAEIAARAERFNEAARTFTPPSPMRHAKLTPLKDGIVELRQKGASLRLIRELLATVGVAVGTDTIARFLAEVNAEPEPQRISKRSGRDRYVRRQAAHARPTAGPVLTAPAAANSVTPQITRSKPATAPDAEPLSERPRTRGPRIADPRNL